MTKAVIYIWSGITLTLFNISHSIVFVVFAIICIKLGSYILIFPLHRLEFQLCIHDKGSHIGNGFINSFSVHD